MAWAMNYGACSPKTRMLCYAMLCYAMLCYAMLCYAAYATFSTAIGDGAQCILSSNLKQQINRKAKWPIIGT